MNNLEVALDHDQSNELDEIEIVFQASLMYELLLNNY